MPSRQKLGLSLAQYKILRIQHLRHLREQLLSRISGYSEIKQVLEEAGVEQESENEVVTSSATLVPAFHVDDRVSPFLLQVKSVRSELHQLRRTLSHFQNQELRVPVKTPFMSPNIER